MFPVGTGLLGACARFRGEPSLSIWPPHGEHRVRARLWQLDLSWAFTGQAGGSGRTHEEVEDGHVHDIQDAVAAVVGGCLFHLLAVVRVHFPPAGELASEGQAPLYDKEAQATPWGCPAEYSGSTGQPGGPRSPQSEVSASDSCPRCAEAASTGAWGGKVTEPHHREAMCVDRPRQHTREDVSIAGGTVSLSRREGI